MAGPATLVVLLLMSLFSNPYALLTQSLESGGSGLHVTSTQFVAPSFSAPTAGTPTRKSCTAVRSLSDSIPHMESIMNRNPDEIRGDCYGAENNSTILTSEDAAGAVGVVPPERARKSTWKRAWKLHKSFLPVLHAFDSCKPPNSKQSLACLWWKALSGNDPNSPAYDNQLSHDLLPSGTRVVVGKRLRRFYPRLHHANVEIRTSFLDQAVSSAISSVRASERTGKSGTCRDEATKIRLISFGAGYDTRSIKFCEWEMIDETVELDLPEVIKVKEQLIGPERLLRRRPWLKKEQLPRLIGVDLNQAPAVKRILSEVIPPTNDGWHNIFLFEGVMIYLDEGVPGEMLLLCSDILRQQGSKGSLCFADRLENVPGGDLDLGREELLRNGWTLEEWMSKPGLARHMGRAVLASNG